MSDDPFIWGETHSSQTQRQIWPASCLVHPELHLAGVWPDEASAVTQALKWRDEYPSAHIVVYRPMEPAV